MRKPASPQIALQLALVSCLGACRAEAPPGDQPTREAIRVEIQVAGSGAEPGSAGAEKPPSARSKTPRAGKAPARRPAAVAAQATGGASVDGAQAPKHDQRRAEPTPSEPGPASAVEGSLLPVSFTAEQDRAVVVQGGGSVVPALVDEQDTLLPQTEQLPGTDSAFYKQLGETLFKAIVDNNPELLIPYFMPVQVYSVLKESKNPPRDWKYRLYAQLTRDIARYHRLLGKNRARARFVGLDVNPEDAIWMKPGREYNKLSYYRLFGSRIRYTDPRGRERSFELSALFSWRGEWYIVHLNGLK